MKENMNINNKETVTFLYSFHFLNIYNFLELLSIF